MCRVAFQFKIRKEALIGLGQIYRRCCENDVPDDIKSVSWIRNKVLHAYYHSAVDDKYFYQLLRCHTVLVTLTADRTRFIGKVLIAKVSHSGQQIMSVS